MGMRRMQGSCASDQLLHRLELEDEQPAADEGQAPHLPPGLVHVVGLGHEVYPRAVAEPVEALMTPSAWSSARTRVSSGQ